MRTTSAHIVTVVIIAALLAGCQTTPQMQEKAKALSVEVGEYRQKQSDRIEKLNADYAKAFAALMQQLRNLSDTQLAQGRQIDCQKIADAMIRNWEDNTLRDAVREAFASDTARERSAIEAADLAVLTARSAYEDQYQKATLELSKLDKVQANLRLLSTDEDRLQTAAGLAIDMAKIYSKLRDQADAEGKKPN